MSQEEGAVGAKVLRQECAWSVPGQGEAVGPEPRKLVEFDLN